MRWQYIDPIIRANHAEWEHLNVNISNSYLLKIFRLLSGTVKVSDLYDNGKLYSLKINYFKLPYSKNVRYSQRLIVDNFEDEISLNELSQYFSRTIHNNEFYRKIEPEILNCLIAREKGNYFESFIFLYRILEGISYSLPLIYTSKSNSFVKSFKALQSYMTKDNGELNFFKKFIDETYKDEDFYNSTIDIDLSCIEIDELKEKYYRLYKEYIKSNHIDSENDIDEIKLKYINFYDFMIEIRNRYFHYLQGSWHNNIETNNIIHPNYFFQPLVDIGINWLAIIFFEIIKFDLERAR